MTTGGKGEVYSSNRLSEPWDNLPIKLSLRRDWRLSLSGMGFVLSFLFFLSYLKGSPSSVSTPFIQSVSAEVAVALGDGAIAKGSLRLVKGIGLLLWKYCELERERSCGLITSFILLFGVR